MIARSRRLAADVWTEYRLAFIAFSPNARAFLFGLGLQHAGFGVLLTVFGIYIRGAGMAVSVVGDVEAAIAMSAAALCLLAPPLIATFGYRRLLLLAGTAYAVARLGMAAFPAAPPLLAFGLVGGVGEGVVQAASAAFLSMNSTRQERTHLFTADLFIRVAAGFAGSLVGGLLPLLFRTAMSEVDAYRLTVAVAAVLLASSLVPLRRISESSAHPRHAFATYLQTMRGFRSWDHLARLVVPQVCIAVGAGMIMPFLGLYLKHELGAGIAQVGLILGVSDIAMGLAALTAPFIARRVGLIRGTVLVQALSVPLLATIPLVHSLPLAAAWLWSRSALMNMAWPLFNQFSLEDVHTAEKPVVSAGLALGYLVGGLVGNVAGGRLMTVSYTLPYPVTAVLYLLGISLTWWFFRDRDLRTEPVPVAHNAA